MTNALIALVELFLFALAIALVVEVGVRVQKWWMFRKSERQRERAWREATKHYGRQ